MCRKYEVLGSHEPATPNPLRSDEVSAEIRGFGEGFVPVLVGKERKRFMVATGHMNHPLMAVLLETSAEELGFEQIGALRVVCDEESFQRLLSVIRSRWKGDKANNGGDRTHESSSNGSFA
jgi:hypothetical protein